MTHCLCKSARSCYFRDLPQTLTREETESCARCCLYNHAFNLSLISQKKYKIESLSSCKGIDFSKEKSDTAYIQCVPIWYEQKEFLESELLRLRMMTEPITNLIKEIEKGERETFEVWRLKFDRKLSWGTAVIEAERIGITVNMFRARFYRIINLAIKYLDIDFK